MRKFFKIISMAVCLTFMGAHPIHVSVADVEFVPEKQELQIIVRIFTDDLEKQIRQESGEPKLDILKPDIGMSSDEIFEGYLNKHLAFRVNGKDYAFEYLGYQVEMGSVISYLLISNVNRLNELEVRNDILLDTYDDQVNLLHVSIGGEIRTMKFIRGEENQSRTFQ
jgi:hypothetical protein